MINSRSEQFKKLLEILVITITFVIGFGFASKSFAINVPQFSENFNLAPGNLLGQNGWATSTGSQAAFQTDAGTVHEGSRSLALTTAGAAGINATVGKITATSLNGYASATISFWYNPVQKYDGQQILYVGDQSGNQVAGMLAQSGYDITGLGHGGDHHFVATSTWYQVNLHLDFINQTFNLSFNGTSTSNYNFLSTSTVNTLWFQMGGCNGNCNYGAVFFDDIQTNADGVNSNSISLLYPTDGLNTRDFSNWIIQATGNVNQIGVRYKLSSSTNYTYVDLTNPASSLTSITFGIPKTTPLSIASGTQTWTAQLYYINSDGTETDTSPITFSVNNIFNDNSNQYSGNAGQSQNTNPFSNSSSSLQDCSITNFGGCLVNAGIYIGNFFFQPHSAFTQYIGTSVNNFKGIFPFSIAFQITSSTQNAANTAYGSEQTFVVPLLIAPGSFTLFDSSTVANVMGPSNKSLYFSTARTIMYAMTGIRIFTIIF